MGLCFSEWVQTQYRQLSSELYNKDLAIKLQWNICWSSISWHRPAHIHTSLLIEVSKDTYQMRCHAPKMYNPDWQMFFMVLFPDLVAVCLWVPEIISATIPVKRKTDYDSGESDFKNLCMSPEVFWLGSQYHVVFCLLNFIALERGAMKQWI